MKDRNGVVIKAGDRVTLELEIEHADEDVLTIKQPPGIEIGICGDIEKMLTIVPPSEPDLEPFTISPCHMPR